ncbi:MAG: hypothetical protein WCC27_10400, partial [Acidobacteriaceae bacterium]
YVVFVILCAETPAADRPAPSSPCLFLFGQPPRATEHFAPPPPPPQLEKSAPYPPSGLEINVPLPPQARSPPPTSAPPQERNPAILILAIATLVLAASLAGLIPARRATSIDPAKALRTE